MQQAIVLLPHLGMAQHYSRNFVALQTLVLEPGPESAQVPGLRM